MTALLSGAAVKLGMGLAGLVVLAVLVYWWKRAGRDAQRLIDLKGTVDAYQDRAQIDDAIRRDPADDRGLRGYERD